MPQEDLEKLVKDQGDVIAEQQKLIERLQTSQNSLIDFVNKHVEAVDRKINAIDNVAFSALGILTLEGKTFELNTENIVSTRAAIEKTVEGFNNYRKDLQAQAVKAAEKEAKKAAKKAEVEAKRAARKGKTVEKVADNDEKPTDEAN